MILALREAELTSRFVFADTGWEAPETYAYLDTLRQRLGITIDVVGFPGGMKAKIATRAGFPSRLGRWCTGELKIEPLRRYHNVIEAAEHKETVSVVGIRGAESLARAAKVQFEDDVGWGGFVWRPLLTWSIEEVLQIHHRHAIPVNPLYLRGHSRVGCYPCIFARKEEIRLIADHAPARIDEIRAIETAVTTSRTERNAVEPGRYSHAQATFFQVKGAPPKGIDEMVAWSRTPHGNKQFKILKPPAGGCMRWGLCEPPTPSEEEPD
jgi:3'-phosphoadenosine 5'-phosphosulfate sulfotransferase (PAPS reductase)/FAD synthetase